MGQGKLGPNGGTVDIDDPEELLPDPERRVLARSVHKALSRTEFAARERIAGRDENADMLLTYATRDLCEAILWVRVDDRAS